MATPSTTQYSLFADMTDEANRAFELLTLADKWIHENRYACNDFAGLIREDWQDDRRKTACMYREDLRLFAGKRKKLSGKDRSLANALFAPVTRILEHDNIITRGVVKHTHSITDDYLDMWLAVRGVPRRTKRPENEYCCDRDRERKIYRMERSDY